MLPPTERFGDRVDDYVRSRPSYPPTAIDVLRDIVGLTPASSIADVGCGTGIFAAQLLMTGATIIGVEPNGPMREACTKLLAKNHRFRVLKGTAEVTGLNDSSVDLVTAAQAFHWFKESESRTEFRRILRPNGWVALIWNERKSKGSQFAQGYELILKECSPEYATVTHRNHPDQDILDWFHNPAAKVHVFEHATGLDLANFLGRAYSSSYVPAEGTPEREVITNRLTQLFRDHETEGSVSMEYEAKLFLGQLGLD